MADLKAFAEQLVNLTVKEVNELAQILKSEYGIEPAAAAVAVAAGPGAGAAAAPVVEEKTAFNVVLKAAGPNKLNVVKLVKEITGLGLKEAKDLVDGAPKPIKEGVDKATSEEVAAKLKDAGAEVWRAFLFLNKYTLKLLRSIFVNLHTLQNQKTLLFYKAIQSGFSLSCLSIAQEDGQC
jgi:large subunit ribosomal protein L7/L12